MARRKPLREVMKTSEARRSWSDLVDKVHEGDVRVIVEKGGVPVAGIVSAADLERLELFEAERERNFSIVDEIREAFKDVTDAELEAEIERALNIARQELREERRVLR